MKGDCLLLHLIIVSTVLASSISPAKNVCKLRELEEQKDLKKFVKSRKSILILFAKDEGEYKKAANLFVCDALEQMKVSTDAAFVNCDGLKGKRMCRQLKVDPTHYVLQFYLDGQLATPSFDRPHTVKSLVYFLKNPKEEAPWSDDPTASGVVHLESIEDLINVLKKPSVCIMFYAPWCGHCKRLKPFYAAAAKEVLGLPIIFAAMDVNGDEFSKVRMQFNITGFPTLLYFKQARPLFPYEGAHTKEALVEWAKNPKPFEKKPVEEEESDWSLSESANHIIFLTDENFDDYISTHNSVYVMFYAPWCGHCKRMKPDFEEAARELSELKPDAVLAAVDATAQKSVANKLKVQGFPTIKYFANGTLSNLDVDYRSKKDIVDFLIGKKVPDPSEKKRSEEDDWESERSSVVHLGGESFAAALKKRKFSLVMFYAPWCGHCKRMKPEFAEAAALLKSNPKLLMGALDCTKHADLCSKYEVTGYPTLKLFKYGKEPRDYMGGRTLKDIVEYLEGLMGDEGAGSNRVEL